MSKSVLIVGHDGGWNLEGSYSRALTNLGWQVQFWQPDKALQRVARGSKVGRLFSTLVNVEPWLRKANLELLQLAENLRPSLVLVIGTEGVRAGTLGQLRAQSHRPILYCLFPDTPHNLVPDRIQCLPMFDRVMTVSSGWIDTFRRLGVEHIHYLPLAADTDLHQPASQNGSGPTRRHDVAFVGNWRPEREAFLEQLVDFDLRIWGSEYWKRNTHPDSRLRAKWGGRALFGAEFAQACADNSILLNIIDGVGWPGPNMRAFEQPACRAFPLVTRTPAVVELFKEGENIECFDSVEEAREKISFYLANDAARQRVADAAYEFVVNEGHTYMDRVEQLLRWASEDGLQ
jgi:spore maturation protein CgeB